MSVKPPPARLPAATAVRAFEAAARHASFAAAARELCVTPAAIALQVKALEAWAGVALFERHSQGVRLSAAAQRALPALSAAVDQWGLALQRLQAELTLGEPLAELRLAALPALAQLWFAPRMAVLQRALPRLRVSISAMEAPPNFLREPFHLGLFHDSQLRTVPRRVERLPLCADALLPVCTAALARRLCRRAVGDLAGQTLLHDAVWASDWADWLRAQRLAPDISAGGARFSLFSLALQAALDGQGVLIARRALVEPLLRRRRLVAPWPDAALPLAAGPVLLLPAHRAGHAPTRALLDWLIGQGRADAPR